MKIRNFTPLVDPIIIELGLVSAAVFGRIWRYANGGVCYASQKTIGEQLSLDRSTVNKHIQILIEAKYIEDLTPNVKRKVHQYRPTRKANITFELTVNADTPTSSVEENITSDVKNPTSAGLVNSNIQVNKQINKQNKEEEANPITQWAKLMGGTINGFHVDEITALEKEWTDHAANLPDQHPDKDKQATVVLCDAIRVTGMTADRPNLKYLATVVDNWRKNGTDWKPEKRKTKKAKAMSETKDVFQRLRDKNL